MVDLLIARHDVSIVKGICCNVRETVALISSYVDNIAPKAARHNHRRQACPSLLSVKPESSADPNDSSSRCLLLQSSRCQRLLRLQCQNPLVEHGTVISVKSRQYRGIVVGSAAADRDVSRSSRHTAQGYQSSCGKKNLTHDLSPIKEPRPQLAATTTYLN